MTPADVLAPADDRADRVADVAMWLFAASVVMLLAALFSGYVLLRTGSDAWPTPWIRSGLGSVADPWFRLLWLVVAAGTARAATRDVPAAGPWITRHPLHVAAFGGLVFAVRTLAAGQGLVRGGYGPATHVAPATWFALNGVLALLVVGGVVATATVALGDAEPLVRRRRARQLTLYWILMAAAFTAIAVGMYLV